MTTTSKDTPEQARGVPVDDVRYLLSLIDEHGDGRSEYSLRAQHMMAEIEGRLSAPEPPAAVDMRTSTCQCGQCAAQPEAGSGAVADAIRLLEWTIAEYVTDTETEHEIQRAITGLEKLTTRPAAEAQEFPVGRQTERIGDMGEGLKLQLFREDDGDIIVSVLPEKHKVAMDGGVQFCTPFSGGGRSQHTHAALVQLMVAMEKDAALSQQPGANDGR